MYELLSRMHVATVIIVTDSILYQLHVLQFSKFQSWCCVVRTYTSGTRTCSACRSPSCTVQMGIIMTGGDPNSVADIKCNSIASVIEKYSIKEHIREYQGATAMKKIIDSELRGADSHRVYPSDTFRNKLRGSAVVEHLTRRTTMSENTPEKHTKRRRVEGAVTPSPAGEHLDSTGRGSTGTTRSGAGSVRSNNTTPRLEL